MGLTQAGSQTVGVEKRAAVLLQTLVAAEEPALHTHRPYGRVRGISHKLGLGLPGRRELWMHVGWR